MPDKPISPDHREGAYPLRESATSDALLETAARPFLSYSFLFKSWMRASDAKIISDGHVIIAANEEVAATFGYHASDLIGKSVDTLLPEAVRERHAKHRAGYVRHPKNRPMGAGGVLKARHKDGSEFSVVVNLLYNTDPNETQIEATVRRVDDDGAISPETAAVDE